MAFDLAKAGFPPPTIPCEKCDGEGYYYIRGEPDGEREYVKCPFATAPALSATVTP